MHSGQISPLGDLFSALICSQGSCSTELLTEMARFPGVARAGAIAADLVVVIQSAGSAVLTSPRPLTRAEHLTRTRAHGVISICYSLSPSLTGS